MKAIAFDEKSPLADGPVFHKMDATATADAIAALSNDLKADFALALDSRYLKHPIDTALCPELPSLTRIKAHLESQHLPVKTATTVALSQYLLRGVCAALGEAIKRLEETAAKSSPDGSDQK